MVDHQSRGHARWAASSTARNWACSGALTLAEQVTTPEKENPAAAWGTACHQVSEKALRYNMNAADYLGGVEKTKEHKIDVDEELAATAQVYIDYVRERLAEYKAETGKDAEVHYEQHFSLTAALKTPFDAGGTGDTVIYFPKWRLIEVVDLKGGRGVIVEVEGNKQLRTYGLGAIITNPGLDVDRVKVTVIQPRAQHKDGIIRDEDFHVADLMEWTADLLVRMHRSKQAMEAFKGMPFTAWWAMYLVAGDHCKFCRAAGTCPALEQRATDAVGLWFDDIDAPQIGKSNAPSNLDPAELARKLDSFDMISEWMNAVRAHAHSLADTGVEIFDPKTDARYKLVDSIGHRKFTDEKAVQELLFVSADLTDDEMHVKKMKTPAMIEKTLGAKKLKKVKAELDKLINRPVTGTSLVRTTKTTRATATASVNKHFTAIE